MRVKSSIDSAARPGASRRGSSADIGANPNPTTVELSERVFFAPEDGRLWLDRQRMLLFHAATFGALRRECVALMGRQPAIEMFTRVGYDQGLGDGALVRQRWPHETLASLLAAGARIHSLEGFVKGVTLRFDYDLELGEFHGEYLWHESVEADEHVAAFGLADAPSCWMQIAYATGYTTGLVGQFILFREIECRAMGAPHCRIVAKPARAWGQEAQSGAPPDTAQPVWSGWRAPAERAAPSPGPDAPRPMIGLSPPFMVARRMLEKVAPTRATVLLIGESGVGKESFANALHALSPRAAGPFVAINCAAIPETLIESELFGVERGGYTGAVATRPGYFERANGGTIFLDEVVSLSLSAQGKLLRTVQEREIERIGGTRTIKIDVRVVAASNVDLREAVRAGRFREDLFFRLNVFPIELPPLRARRDDIPLLLDHFLELYLREHGRRIAGLTRRATEALLSYDYPGNIREMQNLIERGVIFADEDGVIDTPHLFRHGEKLEPRGFSVAPQGTLRAASSIAPLPVSLPQFERQLYADALKAAGGNVSAAARQIGISRAQLEYRLRKTDQLPGRRGRAAMDKSGVGL